MVFIRAQQSEENRFLGILEFQDWPQGQLSVPRNRGVPGFRDPPQNRPRAWESRHSQNSGVAFIRARQSAEQN